MKHPDPLRRAEPFIVLYLILAAIPVGLWCAAGNPITATLPYLNLDQAELFWNTLRDDPAADASEFALAAIDVAWIAWTPFALAAALQLLVTAFRIPRTAIPRILLRLTPTTVVSIVVTGTATAAQASAGAVHATALQHHHLGHEHSRGESSARGHSALETQIRKAITHSEHPRHHRPADTHTVQPGESLWIIAEDAYGEGRDWPEIYDANRGHLEQDGEPLTDPGLIRPGWALTIPHDAAAPAPPARANRAAPAPTRPATGPGGTPTTGAPSATTGRVAPETPAPTITGPGSAASAGARRVPSAAATAAHRAHRPRNPADGPRLSAPWSTGLDLPGGGYIGVSLLIAAAGAALALRRRRARRGGQDSTVSESVRELTVIAARAEMATTGDWDPELETDPTPPPLLRPRPEHLVFGTAPTGTDEAILEPEHHPLTVYTGPGAHQAAAALALSALASQPSHRLVTTKTLAHQLLGADTDPHDPDWLALLPDTATALSTAAGRAGNAEDARTLVIADAQSATTFQISAALAADTGRNRLAILLIGDPPHLAAHPLTTITIDGEGHPAKATGPRAAAFAAARFHMVPRPMATDLYTTLRHDRAARTALRIPAQAHGHPARPANHHPEPDPADDERHQDATAQPAAPEEAEPDPRAAPLTGTSTSASAVGRTPPTGSPASSAPPGAPILLRLLGPLLFENTAGQTRPGPGGRNAQLLTYLALHPRGRTLQQITTAIWNNGGPGGPNRTLVRLRQELHSVIAELAPDHIPEGGEDVQSVVRESHGTYRLNHRLIHTDHAAFTRLETEARTEHNPARRTELAAQALAHVRGDLAEGVSDLDQTWLVDERADLDNRAAALARASAAADLGGQEASPAARAASVFVRTTTP